MTDDTTVTLRIQGAAAQACIGALAARLESLGRTAAVAGNRLTFQSLAAPCDEDRDLDIELSPHDPPDFAAEKILDMLEERGLIALGLNQITGEDEARLRDRLRRLGYIE